MQLIELLCGNLYMSVDKTSAETTDHSFTLASTSPRCLSGERAARYLSVKLLCSSLGGPIQTQRESKGGWRRDGEKLDRERRARGALARLTAPPLTSQRRPSSPPPSSSTSPPLALSAPLPLPLLLPPSPPLALCRSTGLQLPARLSAWGPRVQESMSVCVCKSVCVCVCMCLGEAGDLVACLSALQCFLTFFLFLSHGLEQPSVA